MKFLQSLLIFSLLLSCSIAFSYDGSTKASVVLAGGIIKSKYVDNSTKYKRSNCPVCRGRGWYISGDDITKVPCGYCEPDDGDSIIVHPPIIIRDNRYPKCNGPQCQKR